MYNIKVPFEIYFSYYQWYFFFFSYLEWILPLPLSFSTFVLRNSFSELDIGFQIPAFLLAFWNSKSGNINYPDLVVKIASVWSSGIWIWVGFNALILVNPPGSIEDYSGCTLTWLTFVALSWLPFHCFLLGWCASVPQAETFIHWKW